MIRPNSIMSQLVNLQVFRSFKRRAQIFGMTAVISAIVAFFPERHLASASFTPSDREALGLSGTLGQLGAAGSVFGSQAAVEVALRIGNSDAVRDIVIKGKSFPKDLKNDSRIELQRYLRRKVEVRSLRGGIVLIEMQDTDPDRAAAIVGAYEAAISDELATISRRQTQYKRQVLKRLVKEASADLAIAEAAYDSFRLQNRYPDPRGQIASIADRVSGLQGAIRAKEIDLYRAREIYADRNLAVRQLSAELTALRAQLADAKSISPNRQQNVLEVVQSSKELYRLERDLETAKSLYNSYLRYLRGTGVEDLTADANVRVLEDPHVVTKRQYWLPALALSIAILLVWAAIEAYHLRPPLAERRKRDTGNV